MDHLIVHDLGIRLNHRAGHHAKVVGLGNQAISFINNSIPPCSPYRLSIVFLPKDGSEWRWQWALTVARARDP